MKNYPIFFGMQKHKCSSGTRNFIINSFLRCFRDPIRVPRIRQNYYRAPRMKQNWVPRIREIGSLQVHTGYLTVFLRKKPVINDIIVGGAGNILGVKRIFCPNFPKKLICDKLSPYKFSVYLFVHSIFLYHIAIDLKIENVVHEIWFLITQLKKISQAVQEHCQKPAGSVLRAFSSQFWGLAFQSHSSCCCQQEFSHLTEDNTVYATYSIARYVHPNPVLKMKNTAFLYLPGMDSTKMK